MKKRLFMWIPRPERGLNGCKSTSRENYVLIEICGKLPFDTMCDNKSLSPTAKNYTFLTEAIWQLYGMAKKSKKVRFYEGEKAFYSLAFESSNNNGYEGEYALEKIYREFKRADREEDKNGVDFWLMSRPVQLKTVGHGLTEFVRNVLDENIKKSGLSPINTTLSELMNWKFFSDDELM